MFHLNLFKKSASPKKPGKPPKTEKPEPQPTRCHFQHQNGRRCRLPIADASTPFCGTHRDMLELAKTKEDREAEAAAITAEVYGPVQSLDSALAITHVLGNLFRLTLEGRIPQRKAATLTSQCRALLSALESARQEIEQARLFPHNHPEILDLLAAINGESPEPQRSVVAAHLASPGFSKPDNIEEPPELGAASSRKPVAPPTPACGERPSRIRALPFSNSSTSTQPQSHSHVVAAGLACPERSRGDRPGFSHRDTTEEPPELETIANPASHPTDGITWIGHNLFHPTQSSPSFFHQTPSSSTNPNPAAAHDDANPSHDA